MLFSVVDLFPEQHENPHLLCCTETLISIHDGNKNVNRSIREKAFRLLLRTMICHLLNLHYDNVTLFILLGSGTVHENQAEKVSFQLLNFQNYGFLA